MGSHITLKINAAAVNPAGYCAGELPVIHAYVLLMASLSSKMHEFVLTLLEILSVLVAFRAPTTVVCNIGPRNFRCDFELLEYGLYMTFVVLLLAFSPSLIEIGVHRVQIWDPCYF